MNYVVPCGKHRLACRRADLALEESEMVTLTPGEPFKKVFSLVQGGVKLRGLREDEIGLEEVFMRVTKGETQ